jgi:hypothetical protein
MLQVWHNSTNTISHITEAKPKKLFKALGMVLIVKLAKEERAIVGPPHFMNVEHQATPFA